MTFPPSPEPDQTRRTSSRWRPFLPALPVILIVLFTALPWIQRLRTPQIPLQNPHRQNPQESIGDPSPEDSEDRLDTPVAVAVDPQGNLLVSDRHRVRWIGLEDGVLTTLAGTGEEGYSGDGGPARKARVYDPTGLAVGPQGRIYFASTGNHRIRRVDANGVITTVAGTDTPGFSGDGGPALQAQLNDPIDVAVDRQGSLYIADRGNHRIRKVGTNGIITTFAGGGADPGDGGTARKSKLNNPVGVTLDSWGRLYIAERGTHRVRKIQADGTIATVAGNGRSGTSGDGGPAIQARLSGPHDVAVDGGGNLYIAGAGSHRIRKVTPDGIIRTAAGTGEPGYSGDNGPAEAARLQHPQDVAVDGAGHLYIADTGNHRIRKVSTNGTITTVVGEKDDPIGYQAAE